MSSDVRITLSEKEYRERLQTAYDNGWAAAIVTNENMRRIVCQHSGVTIDPDLHLLKKSKAKK